MSDDNLNLSEFDYLMAAVAEYTMDRNLDKEMFWNIINHVEDGYELLSEQERQDLLSEIEVLRSLRDNADSKAIESGVEHLAHVSDFFAARRMDQSIQKALQGQRVDQLD